MPQQWQELCAQQQRLQVDVLAATLLDSLARHPSPRPVTSSSSSRMKPSESEAVRTQQQQQQQQQQQEVEQLVLASLVSQIHAQAADKQHTTSAGRNPASSSQHHPPRPAAAAPAANPAAVLKVLQQLVANGIAIKPFLSSGPGDRWGLGLYPVTAAVVNHNCDPNCSIR
jgi:hypothetical protein